MTINIKTLDRACLIILVLVSLSCGYWAVRSNAKHWKAFQQEKKLSSKRARDLDLAEKNLQHLRSLLEKKKEELKSLNERIPESAGIGTFIKQLDALIRSREIGLISVHPLPPRKGDHFTRIPIGLVLRGSFIKIYHLIHDLETMKRAIVMDKVMINRSDRSRECLANLTVHIFKR